MPCPLTAANHLTKSLRRLRAAANGLGSRRIPDGRVSAIGMHLKSGLWVLHRVARRPQGFWLEAGERWPVHPARRGDAAVPVERRRHGSLRRGGAQRSPERLARSCRPAIARVGCCRTDNGRRRPECCGGAGTSRRSDGLQRPAAIDTALGLFPRCIDRPNYRTGHAVHTRRWSRADRLAFARWPTRRFCVVARGPIAGRADGHRPGHQQDRGVRAECLRNRLVTGQQNAGVPADASRRAASRKSGRWRCGKWAVRKGSSAAGPRTRF